MPDVKASRGLLFLFFFFHLELADLLIRLWTRYLVLKSVLLRFMNEDLRFVFTLVHKTGTNCFPVMNELLPESACSNCTCHTDENDCVLLASSSLATGVLH